MTQSQPIVAQDAPIAVELEAGQPVWWCACGRSMTQPYCDGSHAGSGIEPTEFIPSKTKTYYLCACKQSKKKPLCDGSHNSLT